MIGMKMKIFRGHLNEHLIYLYDTDLKQNSHVCNHGVWEKEKEFYVVCARGRHLKSQHEQKNYLRTDFIK